ncbi:MAG: endoglucanase [Methylobacteriaceae bacterium]|nr:endoglucanase [Methylobacteriaceae bacterium]
MQLVVRLLASLLLIGVLAAPIAAQTTNRVPAGEAPRPLKLDGRALPLGGALKSPEVWLNYKSRFITDHGRVIDTGNNFVSHSEGQGYGMLLAVAANDRPVFDLLWGWTRANLLVRGDDLFAWRWEPGQRPAVADVNNASDGDLLIAWALTEAADFWGDPALRIAARRIAVDIGRKLVVSKSAQGALLLPALAGFAAEDRNDGPVVNLSYWVFPALTRLQLVAPEIDWNGVMQSGLALLKIAQTGPSRLPGDWTALRDGTPKAAQGFPNAFAYNAIRVPLYLALAGIGEREHYEPFAAWARHRRGQATIVDLASGRDVETYGESGYAAVPALTLCVTDEQTVPAELRTSSPLENYYPATLRALALIALQMRYPSCLRG